MPELNTERILIVDDEEFIRDILSRMLSAAGYNCTTRADGMSALSELSERKYDLVLQDYKMPVISGEQVLQEVVRRYPETAVVMVTAIADAATVIKLMKAGAADYLVKPVDRDVLLISIKRALEKRRLLKENREYQLHLEEKVKEQTARIRRSVMNSITSLVFALEAKDTYTSGHSQRVAGIAASIAGKLGLGPETQEQVRFAGLVHDIGKIGIKELVLNKDKELTDEEYYHIASHSTIGERILQPIMEDEVIPLMVRHHHERYDGKGYPDGLCGDKIPLGARILAIADTYDAMTSDRPYRKALNHQVALSELTLKAGIQFDAGIAKVFTEIQESDLLFAGSERLMPA
jgi:putative two-component system response regulator